MNEAHGNILLVWMQLGDNPLPKAIDEIEGFNLIKTWMLVDTKLNRNGFWKGRTLIECEFVSFLFVGIAFLLVGLMIWMFFWK